MPAHAIYVFAGDGSSLAAKPSSLGRTRAAIATRRNMTPAEYYSGPFREHFGAFWRSLDELGSVSRVRAQLTPSRFAGQHAQHFSVVDLVARPGRRLPDHLSTVPQHAQADFLCALLYTVLVDQVMYSHRRVDYAEFESITRYPKMDRTVGYARTLMMANPYELLESEVLASRGLNPKDVEMRFEEWAAFIARDLLAFFNQRRIGSTTWELVRGAMLADPSVTWGRAGAALATARPRAGTPRSASPCRGTSASAR